MRLGASRGLWRHPPSPQTEVLGTLPDSPRVECSHTRPSGRARPRECPPVWLVLRKLPTRKLLRGILDLVVTRRLRHHGRSGMNGRHDPLVQRDRLRAKLRKARESTGETQKAVAAAMEWSTSKLVRIESGEVGVSIQDVRALLTHYGIRNDTEIDTALQLAREGRDTSPYSRYSDVFTDAFIWYLAYESSASVIRSFHPSIIPGLLQIEDYAKALLLDGFVPSSAMAERVWEGRSGRQQLHDLDSPPSMLFFVDESALLRHVGGAAVLREQLLHVTRVADRSHVELHILPFSFGFHAGMMESFTILEFDDPDLNDIVYLETSDRRAFDDPPTTIQFVELADRMTSVTLSGRRSFDRVHEQIAYLATL